MIKFINENNERKLEVTLSDDQTLDSMLKEFEYFLRGCSFVFDHFKVLTLASDDDVVLSKKEYDILVERANGKSKRK